MDKNKREVRYLSTRKEGELEELEWENTLILEVFETWNSHPINGTRVFEHIPRLLPR